MSNFLELVDLASERLGGSVLWASDDFFASKDNLLKPSDAVFIEGKYTDRGKWMDGWESRRKRALGHDSCIIRLGLPGIVRGFVVDTSHFKGNYPQACSIEGASIEGYPDLSTLTSDAIKWTEILPRTDLEGDTKNAFEIANKQRFTHLRMHIYPDGGVARLRVHGEVVPHMRWMGRRDRPEPVDLAAAAHGALVVACNDMFFGSRHNLVMPGRGVNMGDGWETKRSRRPGPDWVVVRLAAEGSIERVVLDTLHFKGNSPESAAVDVACFEEDPDGANDNAWTPLLARTKLQPHTEHVFEDDHVTPGLVATHARLRIWPDGGVSRMRLYGVVTARGRERTGLKYLRSMPVPELEEALRSCCGSTAWVRAMVDERLRNEKTFSSLDVLKKRAGELWAGVTAKDWEEAFGCHPRIGEKKAQAAQTATSAAWSAGEQAKVAEASAAVLDELRAVNRAYEEKFGRIYIVCATGRSAEEMLAIAKERMANDEKTELERAAEEQRKITELRLEKLVLR